MRNYLHALCVLGLLASSAVAAECTPVENIPTVIRDPGSYCLTRSHVVDLASHRAIDIASDDVQLDFAGHSIRNVHGRTTTAFGVFTRDMHNVTVRGGALAGFHTAVLLDHSGSGCALGIAESYRVEDMDISGSARTGIYLHGCSLAARGNRIWNTGTDMRLPASGIYATGALISLVDNDVQRVIGSDREGVGILVDWNSGAGVVEGNRVIGAPNGVYVPPGVGYRDNTVMEARVQAYFGGTDAGGNH